ncbi:uncharacterized protein LOC130960490 isoform X2 [Arachis stenosperma]|uniref:uncharacterized protein LOC130960490 isoform X2 n=1 Tax=Arachis stenosperma TaxID=217475 RepID=UPI0025AB8BE8|nr:uncharacterized protein LOC130960490 isoform X2 [Arachis stenosperma]
METNEEEPDVRQEEGERSEAEIVSVTAVYLCHYRTATLRCLTGTSVTIARDLWLPENTAIVAAEGGRSLAAVLVARDNPVATGTTTRDAATWLSHFFLVADMDAEVTKCLTSCSCHDIL